VPDVQIPQRVQPTDMEMGMEEYVARLEAVRAELRKAESWGDHRTVTSADFAGGVPGGGGISRIFAARAGRSLASVIFGYLLTSFKPRRTTWMIGKRRARTGRTAAKR